MCLPYFFGWIFQLKVLLYAPVLSLLLMFLARFFAGEITCAVIPDDQLRGNAYLAASDSPAALALYTAEFWVVAMAQKRIMTSQFVGTKVFGGKDGTKRIGKVHSCVFHPTEKRCIGFLVKRPDLLLMFHRSDSFVALDGFTWEDGAIVLNNEKGTTGEAACKRLGISWDDCVLWVGLVMCTKAGDALGYVGSVEFDEKTGLVTRVFLDEGSTAGVLLGKREIPANMVLGFKRGVGSPLSAYAKHQAQEDVNAPTRHEMALAEELSEFGALLVTDDAKGIQASGGLAEKAGAATAVAGAKVKDAVESASDSVKKAAETAKPTVQKATKVAGKAVNKGAYATGKQLSRAKGMFGAFKEEFDKARK